MPTEYKKEHEDIWITPPPPSYIESENDFTTFINATDTSISPYSSVSPYLAASNLPSAASWTISFVPKETKTTIKAEASFISKEENDKEFIEKYLREKVATELARQLLAEDLIKIQGSTELESDGSTVYKMRAEVKIIQE